MHPCNNLALGITTWLGALSNVLRIMTQDRFFLSANVKIVTFAWGCARLVREAVSWGDSLVGPDHANVEN